MGNGWGNVFFLCSGYSPEAKLLISSVYSGDVDRVRQVLMRYPELLAGDRGLAQASGRSVWHFAVQSGSVRVLCYLAVVAKSERVFVDLPARERELKVKRQLDLSDDKGQTPLMMACLLGRADCAALLVRMGVDLFIGEDQSKLTALHLAARSGHAACIRMVLRHASIEQGVRRGTRIQDAGNTFGLVPLHFAAAWGHLDCIEALLEYEAFPAPQSRALTSRPLPFSTEVGGATPLHYAAVCNNAEAAKAILRHHVLQVAQAAAGTVDDIRAVRDACGNMPYQVARGMSAVGLAELLNPHTDLMSTFGLHRDASSSRVPKLCHLAAAALQLKLMMDVQRAADTETGGFHSRPISVGVDGSHHRKEALPEAQPHALTLSGMLDDYLRERGTHGPESSPSCRADGSELLTAGRASQENKEQGRIQQPAMIGAQREVLPTVSDQQNNQQATVSDQQLSPQPAKMEEQQRGVRPAVARPCDIAVTVSKALVGRTESCCSEDPDRLCTVCFERPPNIGIEGCMHRMCSECAMQLCARLTEKPLACPFCRKSVGAFYRASGGVGMSPGSVHYDAAKPCLL